jgi:hypothetical protein
MGGKPDFVFSDSGCNVGLGGLGILYSEDSSANLFNR